SYSAPEAGPQSAGSAPENDPDPNEGQIAFKVWDNQFGSTGEGMLEANANHNEPIITATGLYDDPVAVAAYADQVQEVIFVIGNQTATNMSVAILGNALHVQKVITLGPNGAFPSVGGVRPTPVIEADSPSRSPTLLSNIAVASGVVQLGDVAFEVGITKRSDTDLDYDTDFADFNNLASNYGQTGSHLTIAEGDCNGDLVVNLTDVVLFTSEYGTGSHVGGAPGGVGTDVELVVHADGSLELVGNNPQMTGYSILSAAGNLIPDADVNAMPFMFYLSNAANDVTAGSVGSQYNFSDSMALDAAVTPGTDLEDLTFQWGDLTDTYDGYVVAGVCFIAGDLDHDGDVDIFDWAIFQPNYGTTTGMLPGDGDLDGDGDVDIFDWAIFQPNYGTSCPTNPVPEPATLVLLGAAAPILLKRRTKRGR
ncbi:MAG: PEP-CTERM sorting domain-containing protein, partial [Planctomycetes bacterium]|nr:PEP-CTERM sorting domain-containing protein [Planctomycetota bacterium]